jgi:hypothetical protein
VSLARVTLEMQASDMAPARAASAQLAQVPDAAAGWCWSASATSSAPDDVVLWNAAGQMLASAGQSRFRLNPERPTPSSCARAPATARIARSKGWTI